MDDIDRQLVHILRRHGRISQEELARMVNLSRPAVHERLRRLEARAIIRGYTVLVDWEALGMPITAFTWVRTAGVACSIIGQAFLNLSDADAVVEACHRVTGEWCMLLQVRTTSPLTLQTLIDRIRAVPGVQLTTTNLALSSISDAADTESTKEQNDVDLDYARR